MLGHSTPLQTGKYGGLSEKALITLLKNVYRFWMMILHLFILA